MDVANAKPVEGLMLDGLSILPVWSGKTNELKRSIYTEIGYAKGVVTKDWKYIAIRYNDEVLDRGFNPNIKEKLVRILLLVIWICYGKRHLLGR